MDWLGPIFSACTATGYKYILIVVDYFFRFVWAKAYVEHEGKKTVHMYKHYICFIFGFSRSVYSDNGSYFVNQWVERLFREHGVTHYTGPISHPFFTGLMERAVQAMQSFLKARCLEREEPGAWSLDVRDGVLYINTKTIRIYKYLPAELMLGFEPKFLYFDTDMAPLPDYPEALQEELPAHQIQIYTAFRDENILLASEAAAYSSHLQASRRNQRKSTIPNPGDLVIVRNHAVDSQHGRKLEKRWLGPRLLTRMTGSGLSGYVRELHGEGKEKRYYVDDMKLYFERKPYPMAAGVISTTSTMGTTPVVTGGRGINIAPAGIGGRAVLLFGRRGY